ncbi:MULTISPECIES: DUF2259 domain-containing protein [Rhodomicrobium]|uniref:DUF2259 domain-containing protein n=1 Tax=Rhodomicrobium TaxID=1068 RepID=UPI000B4AC6EA|nr:MULTISPECIES: DUF2259 domain-containing protein [Rhodomicrobium]
MTAIRYIERTVLIILLLSALSTSNARGGEYASRSVIGFSTDGRYFAFEQYGMFDAVDGAYAEIFIIDSENDSPVPGTPIRKSSVSQRASLAQVRRAARRQAQRLLSRLRITEPGIDLASNPRNELSADPHRVVVNVTYRFAAPDQEPVTLILNEKPIASEDCAKQLDIPPKGFTLRLERKGEEPAILHDEQQLPPGRGCPLSYAISDVYAYDGDEETTLAVLVLYTKRGFEEPDGRYLAVTHRLPWP